MTNQQQPLIPPPELMHQWASEWMSNKNCNRDNFMASKSAQWGADTELEECCKYMQHEDFHCFAAELRAARRPKPLSLKLQAINDLNTAYNEDAIDGTTYCNIRRALEQLDD